jgi:iron-sulfur cluster assembly protein
MGLARRMQKLQPLVNVTPAAQVKLAEVMEQEKATDSLLKIEVYAGGGCACSGGYRYALSLEKEAGPSDVVEEVRGIKFAVGKDNADLIRGSKIDYFESLQRTGFKIENPNVQVEACGCGGH